MVTVVSYFILFLLSLCSGPGSSVGIATELRAGRSGDRIPVGRNFSPVQTYPGAHPASCTIGTGSFLEVKYGRGVLLTTHSLLVPWSWKSRAIPLPTLWASTEPVTGTLYIYLLLRSLFRENHISAVLEKPNYEAALLWVLFGWLVAWEEQIPMTTISVVLWLDWKVGDTSPLCHQTSLQSHVTHMYVHLRFLPRQL